MLAKQPKRTRPILLAAACVALVAAGGVAVLALQSDDDALPVSDTAPATTSAVPVAPTQPGTTAPAIEVPSTTATLPAAPDDEVARSMLLPTGGYSAGWQVLLETTGKLGAGFDPSVARNVPECASYVESVFNVVDSASHKFRLWIRYEPVAFAVQYVVVLPDVTTAQSVFTIINSPDFGLCAESYNAAQGGNVCCDGGYLLPGAFAQPTSDAPDGAVGDDFAYRRFAGSWLVPGGETVVPETSLDATIRIDRALAFIGSASVEGGADVVPETEFHDILVRVVDRAASALGVTTDPSAPGDSQADATIAAAALSTPEELGADWTQFRDGTAYADFRFDSDGSSSSRCDSFLDTVFAPMGGGVTDNRLFFPPGQDMQHIDPVRQHVTVLADEAVALAAWRAMASPDFQACALASTKMFDALRFSTSEVPPFVPDGNHVALYHFVKPTPGLEDREFVAALIHVGRTITYLDAMQVNWLGEPGVSDEQFAAVIDRVAATTEQALSA